jgi:hypothetical protein
VNAPASADALALNLLPMDVSPRDAASADSTASDAEVAEAAKSHAEASAASATSAEKRGVASGNSTADADMQSGRKVSKTDATKPSKRKSRRSAVPSWDEILFGD